MNCTDGSIRLYGGSSAMDGILHVCANGAWGTVCSGYWDNQDNAVACRQLGFLSNGGCSIYLCILLFIFHYFRL